MLERIAICDQWGFHKTFSEEMISPSFNSCMFESVRLPHTCQMLDYNYINEEDYQMICAYHRVLDLSNIKQPGTKRFFLYFEGAAHEATIYVNGQKVFVHQGGYTPFRVEITDFIHFNRTNNLIIRLDTREKLNQPPFGHVIDYLTNGGIYREVYLEITGDSFFEHTYVHCKQVMQETPLVCCDIDINSESLADCYVEIALYEKDSRKKLLDKRVQAAARLQIHETVDGLTRWSPNQPFLYEVQLQLIRKQPEADFDQSILLDTEQIKFGVREAVFKKDGFYLNGEKVFIRGLNRHQSYPYVGYAMPERVQRRDAWILKNELGLNAVRTSHYPQSRHFMDACDELGLMVFTEIPGWQHIGDLSWQQTALEHVREMIIHYRNHPSIILWGVRINESQDNDDFYKKTNALAKTLDPYRQTGGVRYLKNSSLLEDVYTYNDFSHTGDNDGVEPKHKVTSDLDKGYLVTEYNGHMYPTKMFDDEPHRLSHALRHARVLSDLAENEDIAGGFGWCMADYNTHQDFGSGDRICYHGVLDMFRNAKMGAAVYASQQSSQPVLQISTDMNIGDHPASHIGPVYAFTNMDKIRLYKNDQLIKEFYPERKHYPGLKHPPVLIDDFIGDLLITQENYPEKTAKKIKDVLNAIAKYGQHGLPLQYKLKMARLMLLKGLTLQEGTRLYLKYIGNWGEQVTHYCFEGIKNNAIACSIEKKPGSKVILKAEADTRSLIEDETYDVASVRIEAQDEHGQRLSYYMEPVRLTVSGGLMIIGPDCISLKGGVGGTYVKTIGIPGPAYLHIKSQHQNITLSFEVHCNNKEITV